MPSNNGRVSKIHILVHVNEKIQNKIINNFLMQPFI